MPVGGSVSASAVPWLLAAVLSVLLVVTPRRIPRRLLLLAGWSATAIVATIGPAACWALLVDVIRGEAEFGDMAGWVFGVVYGSWLLWAIAAGLATLSYQVRSATDIRRGPGPVKTLPANGTASTSGRPIPG